MQTYVLQQHGQGGDESEDALIPHGPQRNRCDDEYLGLDVAELEMKRLEAQKKTIKDIEEERGVLLKFEA